MDVVLYARYRRGGGKRDFPTWEFSAGISSWDETPAPAQVGRRLFEGRLQKKLPPDRAALVNNITHGAHGLLCGALYGITVESLSQPRSGTGSRSVQACGPSITRSSRLPCCTSRSGSTTARPWPAISAPTCCTGPSPPPLSGSCPP